MIILDIRRSKKPKGVEITALLGIAEHLQLLGHIDSLCVFSSKTISEPTTLTRTGARNNFAKYLLFPAKLRRLYSADEYDFEKLTCGILKYKDRLYVIYGVPMKYPPKAKTKADDGLYYQSANGNNYG